MAVDVPSPTCLLVGPCKANGKRQHAAFGRTKKGWCFGGSEPAKLVIAKTWKTHLLLVGAFKHEFCFFSRHVGNVLIPTDYIIFFRGVGQPPTSLCFDVPYFAGDLR